VNPASVGAGCAYIWVAGQEIGADWTPFPTVENTRGRLPVAEIYRAAGILRRGARETTEWIDGARLAAAVVGLGYAAYTDARTREVQDGVWYGLGALAAVLFALDLNATYGAQAAVMAVPAALIFAVAVVGGEFVEVVPGDAPPPEDYQLNDAQRGRLRLDLGISAAFIVGAIALFVFSGSFDLGARPGLLQGPVVQSFSAVLMIGLALLMFMFSLIAGGADAKCLMMLALLFPVAPALSGLPLVHPPGLAVLSIPFALAAFFNGAILLVAARLPVSPIVSARRGMFRFPESFFGVPKPVDKVNLEREWVLGGVEGGAFKRKLIPRHGAHSDEKQKEVLQFLKDKGEAMVFVSPKLPFMVYLLAGFIVLVVLSCPLYFVGGFR
jgi:hypothetical protein